MNRILLLCLSMVVLLNVAPTMKPDGLAWAAVTVDTTGSQSVNTTNGSDAWSYSHTIAADANFIVLAISVVDSGGVPKPATSATVGGEAMTQVPSCAPTNTNTAVTYWYKANPSTGAQTVAGSTTDTGVNDELTAISLSLKGAAGTVGTCVPATGSSADANLNSVVSAVGALVVGSVSTHGSRSCSADATAPVSTEALEVDNDQNTHCLYYEAGATSVNMLVDVAGGAQWAAGGFSVAAASTRRAVPPIFLQ